MKILNIVGARPNFIKVAPIHRILVNASGVDSVLVHTGQHQDEQMSGVFFEQLQLPVPDYFLGISGGSHTQQTARTMLEFEEVLKKEKPDVVLVVGDVNATLACSLVAVKEHIPLVHVEAGLRSGDCKMPEEINRILTDRISDHLFVTEQAAVDNLKREGVVDEKIHYVGNVMIDSLIYCRSRLLERPVSEDLYGTPRTYVLMTMHRPDHVDSLESLTNILQILKQIVQVVPVLFPMHPRTLKNIRRFNLTNEFEQMEGLRILEPQGYLEFLRLMENSLLVVTDSGGIQEETTFLNIPCITLRENTERPSTVELGTNYLQTDLSPCAVSKLVVQILEQGGKKGTIPPLWDGFTAERIVAILREKYLK